MNISNIGSAVDKASKGISLIQSALIQSGYKQADNFQNALQKEIQVIGDSEKLTNISNRVNDSIDTGGVSLIEHLLKEGGYFENHELLPDGEVKIPVVLPAYEQLDYFEKNKPIRKIPSVESVIAKYVDRII